MAVDPPTSVVVCSRGRPDLLADMVASVLAGATTPDELIVVDQSDEPHPMLASLEGTPECVVRYRHTAVIGASAARNAGIEIASHPVIALVDDDVLVAADW